MEKADSHQITQLLDDWSRGDQTALDKLMPMVYDELRKMARRHMSGQPVGHTFQTTELIHEAYMKLAGQKEQNFKNRSHFFGVAAKAMRHILVDYARSKSRKKRGGWQEKITLTEGLNKSEDRSEDIVALDEALNRLAELENRKANVVELKYFGGMTFNEIAEALKISVKTAQRDWRLARMWLLRELAEQ